MDVLLLAILDTKEVAAALQEAGMSKGQLENAINVRRAPLCMLRMLCTLCTLCVGGSGMRGRSEEVL